MEIILPGNSNLIVHIYPSPININKSNGQKWYFWAIVASLTLNIIG